MRNGSFGYDPAVGDLETPHAITRRSARTSSCQAALTVAGQDRQFRPGLRRRLPERATSCVDHDYSDYSFFYDTYYTNYCSQYPDDCFDWGAQFVNDDGDLINPSQYIHGTDGYTMQSHELRIASPKENRFRVVAGLFYQDFEHEIFQRYQINDLATRHLGAALGRHDLADQPAPRGRRVAGHLRRAVVRLHREADRHRGPALLQVRQLAEGFFGFNENYYDGYGTAQCFSDAQYNGSPCTNLDANVDDSGNVPKLNLTYRFDDGQAGVCDLLRRLPSWRRQPQRRFALRRRTT